MSVHETLDRRDLTYLKFVFGRAQGESDEKIITELADPDIDSPAVLYRRLSRDGYPVCQECGAAPVKGNHCEPYMQKRERRARRSEDEAIELPSAGDAVPLFMEVLRELNAATEQLEERREYLKDERFVATYLPKGPQPQGRGLTFFGASQQPPEPLTKLIAAYVLTGEGLEPLVAMLHPEPSEADRVRLEQAAAELNHKAGQLARLVRGGELRRGPTSGEEASREQLIAWMVREHRDWGLSDKEIREVLERDGYPVTIGEMRRLEKLDLP